MEVRVQGGGLDKAVKTLKRKLQQDGLFRELRQRRFHEKPGIKRRRKAKDAQKRRRKRQR